MVQKSEAIAAISLLCLCHLVDGQKSIAQMNADERDELLKNIATGNDSYVEQAIQIINTLDMNSGRGSPAFALKIITTAKSVRAIPALLARIEFTPERIGAPSGPGSQPYPIEDALSELGMPAVKAIRERMDTETDQLRLALMAQVICNVMGRNPAAARVQDWLDEIPPENRANLRVGKNLDFILQRLKAKDGPDPASLDLRMKQE